MTPWQLDIYLCLSLRECLVLFECHNMFNWFDSSHVNVTMKIMTKPSKQVRDTQTSNAQPLLWFYFPRSILFNCSNYLLILPNHRTVIVSVWWTFILHKITFLDASAKLLKTISIVITSPVVFWMAVNKILLFRTSS